MSSQTRFLTVLLLAFAMLIPAVAATALPPGGTFVDDDGNTHEGYIEAIAAAGITSGCNPPLSNEYCPTRHVSRGEMAAFLSRALNLSGDGGKDWFNDDNDSIFETQINQLAAAGITGGCNPPANNKYCPGKSVTRAQMAAFLVRAYNLNGSTSGNPFVDDDGSVFEGDIENLRSAGITYGCNPPVNNRFCPGDPVRRDAMASFIGRAEGLPANVPPPRVDLGAIDVHVYPGDNIGSLASSKPAGTVFMIHGTHHRQSIRPKDGQQFHGAEDAVLDGDDRTSYAFSGSANNVVVSAIEIHNYSPDAQHAPVEPDGDNWTVQGNEIHHNAALGVRMSGDSAVLLSNNIHHNSQLGISMQYSDGGLVEGNEIAYNNWENEFRWGWEAGGTKFWSTTNLTVRGNWSHHNQGPGLWSDHDNKGIIYENNLVEDNLANGIFHEIGYDGIIRNNTIRRNGFGHDSWLWGSGILLASSQGVEVYGNVVTGNYNGITMTQQDRGTGSYGPYVVRNNYVHDNLVIDSGATGAATDIGGDIFSSNNRFENNDYVGDVNWAWGGGFRSWNAWRDYGHDDDGGFTP